MISYAGNYETMVRTDNCSLTRVRLTPENPYALIGKGNPHHIAFYPLIGSFSVGYQPVDFNAASSSMVVGGRDSILVNQSGSLFVPPQKAINLILSLCHGVSRSADMLIFMSLLSTTDYEEWLRKWGEKDITPEFSVAIPRTVGEGMYKRQVTDCPPPEWSALHVGETLSRNAMSPDGQVIGGCWSSWPPHASAEEAEERYKEHEEVFFVISPTTGMMLLNGYFNDGKHAQSHPIVLSNGHAYVVPLGSHSVVFHPQIGPCWGWYFWGYKSYLRKTYNSFADDIGVYVK